MSSSRVVQAWRHHDRWLSLSDADRATMPGNPAGTVEIVDADLERVIGGFRARGVAPDSHEHNTSQPYCAPGYPWDTYWTGSICCA
jgi:mersacidin/lichenicidin family type 2 lantibiotic